MKKNLIISILMTVVTTILLGLVYPLIVTGLAQLIFHDKANGQLIVKNGQVVGSRGSLSMATVPCSDAEHDSPGVDTRMMSFRQYVALREGLLLPDRPPRPLRSSSSMKVFAPSPDDPPVN